MDVRWLSISEYARHHNLSDMTVRRRIKNGRLRAVLKEGKYYIEQGQVRPTPDLAFPEPPKHSSAKLFTDRVLEDSMLRSQYAEPEETRMESPYVVPKEISAPILNNDQAVVDASRLLQYCEASLRSLKSTEETIKREWEARVNALKSELSAKNLEIQSLEQKVHDLGELIEAIHKPL